MERGGGILCGRASVARAPPGPLNGITLVDLVKALSAIIAFVVGVALTAAALTILDSARESHRQVQLLSDVHDPMRQCLDEIARTYDRGDVALAEQKARLLQKRWAEYLRSGGRPPELFANEVMQFGEPTTRPASKGTKPGQVCSVSTRCQGPEPALEHAPFPDDFGPSKE